MPCQVPPIRIGAACQPCEGREGLAALARRRPHMVVDGIRRSRAGGEVGPWRSRPAGEVGPPNI